MFEEQCLPVLDNDGIEWRIVICPICLAAFSQRHLARGLCGCGQYLTVEEAPPNQQKKWLALPGSFRRCLTCNRCNTEIAGNGYERRHNENYELVNRLRDARQVPDGGLAEFLGERMNDIRAQHPQVQLEFRNLRIERIPSPDPAFEIDGRTLELKSAYCIAFAALGYAWALGDALAPIRQIISSAETGQPFTSCAVEQSGYLKPRMIYLFDSPEPMLAVMHPSFHRDAESDETLNCEHLVWLPGPGNANPKDFLQRIASGLAPRNPYVASFPWPPSGEVPRALDHEWQLTLQNHANEDGQS